MADDHSLLDMAAALADGTKIDWESAAGRVSSDADRALVRQLELIAAVTQADRREGPQDDGSAGPIRSSEAAEPAVRPAVVEWASLEILEQVGRGTFGDIYRAFDPRLDREVALKIMRVAEPDEARASTAIHEGRLLARVRHPNVVTVYGAERIDGRVGVWMEYLHGPTLEEELREDGPFDPGRVIAIGRDLGSALATVHRAGVVHGDVKAQNVMRDRDGRLVLTDFGAGVALEETSRSGELGTPLYVAPEVLAGQPATPRTDLYSFGVLLYHLLTGEFPVPGRSLAEVRAAHAEGRRVLLRQVRPDVPAELARTIERALDADPARRHDTLDSFCADLSGAGRSQRRERGAAGGRLRGGHLPAAALVSVVAAVGLAAALRASAWFDSDQDSVPVAADTRGVIVIEFPGATRTELFEINDHGVMVGAYEDAHRRTRGFTLAEGRFTTIDVPDSVRTRPTGLNNSGTIAGDYTDGNGVVHGFLLAANRFQVIDVPGSTFTRAGGVNDAGDVVGDFRRASGAVSGFLLKDGAFTILDVPDALSTRAIGLSDTGLIAGDYLGALGVRRGFLFANGGFTDIVVRGARSAQAFDVDARGTVVGSYESNGGRARGFSTRNGGVTLIDVPGAVWTQAAAINGAGAIVGAFLGADPPRVRGFVLQP